MPSGRPASPPHSAANRFVFTAGCHAGWIQKVKTQKDHDGDDCYMMYLTQAVMYHVHVTTTRGRFIEKTRSKGKMKVDLGKMRPGRFWGFVADEVFLLPLLLPVQKCSVYMSCTWYMCPLRESRSRYLDLSTRSVLRELLR